MPKQEEKRYGWLFRISPGEWIVVAGVIFGAITSSILLVSDVAANKDDIKIEKEAREEQNREMRAYIKEEMQKVQTSVDKVDGKVNDILKLMIGNGRNR